MSHENETSGFEEIINRIYGSSSNANESLSEENQRWLLSYYDQTSSRLDAKSLLQKITAIAQCMEKTGESLLGYMFNGDGKLVHCITNEPFQFVDQIHYDLLALAVSKYVQDSLVKNFSLKIFEIPFLRHHPGRELPWSFVFCTEDVFENQKMLILLVGTGKIQAGLWAQSLCINDSLSSGSVIPYVEEATKKGWSVLILNPNIHDNVPLAESPEKHLGYVWEHLVTSTKATHIGLVAHSYGGVCLMSLFESQLKSAVLRLKAVAFTDSVHHMANKPSAKDVQVLLRDNSINWQSSSLPLDTVIDEFNEYMGCKCVSAGTTNHPLTNYSAIESIFNFIDTKFASATMEV